KPQPRAATQQLRAFPLTGFDVAEHSLHVLAGDQRAHLGAGIHAVADYDPARRFGETREKFVREFFLEDQPRTRAAHFALPGGKPASAISSKSRIAVSGVVSAGLRMQQFPAASPGASFHAAMSNG